MENEKEHQKKIDLTLKLSSYDENGEERRLTRSSSVVGEASRVQGDQSLGRTSSLPAEALPEEAERQLMVALVSPSMFALVAASTLNGYTPSTLPPLTTYLSPSQISGLKDTNTGVTYNIPYIGLVHSTEGSINSMSSQEISLRPGDTKLGNPDKLGNYCSLKGDVMEILSQMPNVSTTGDGPNGKRIEGFLYKYRNGEVCIVCICHGNFFTPAEFVKHAGGKKVANPMKHITVSFNSF